MLNMSTTVSHPQTLEKITPNPVVKTKVLNSVSTGAGAVSISTQTEISYDILVQANCTTICDV